MKTYINYFLYLLTISTIFQSRATEALEPADVNDLITFSVASKAIPNSTYYDPIMHKMRTSQTSCSEEPNYSSISLGRIAENKKQFAIERSIVDYVKKGGAGLGVISAVVYGALRAATGAPSPTGQPVAPDNNPIKIHKLAQLRAGLTALAGSAASTMASTMASFVGYRWLDESSLARTMVDTVVATPSLKWYITTHTSFDQYAQDIIRYAAEYPEQVGTGLYGSHEPFLTTFYLFIKHFERVLGYISYTLENFPDQAKLERQRAKYGFDKLIRLGHDLSLAANRLLSDIPEQSAGIESLVTAIRAEVTSFSALEKQ